MEVEHIDLVFMILTCSEHYFGIEVYEKLLISRRRSSNAKLHNLKFS